MVFMKTGAFPSSMISLNTPVITERQEVHEEAAVRTHAGAGAHARMHARTQGFHSPFPLWVWARCQATHENMV